MSDNVIGPADGRRIPRFAGPSTFARLPRIDEVPAADITVLGIPFDSGVSYRPGARFGPAHIRQSSRLLRPYNPELHKAPFARAQVADAGDVACTPFSIVAALDQIRAAAASIQGKILALGGDHTIVLALLREMAHRHGPVAVLHFDAHLDTWDTYFDAPYTHGTPFRRASEEGLIDRSRSLHVGIRGPLYADVDLADSERLGFDTVHCTELDSIDLAARMRDRLGAGPIYISVDVDVLDPAFAPGTGTPEAGGMTSRELLAALRSLNGLPVVGADIVEVAPAYDHAEITGIAAAHIGYELLSIMGVGYDR
jgi:agmatinase